MVLLLLSSSPFSNLNSSNEGSNVVLFLGCDLSTEDIDATSGVGEQTGFGEMAHSFVTGLGFLEETQQRSRAHQ